MAALQKMPTPRALIVDVSGEDQPLTALGDLSDVVEPDVRVLVIGESRRPEFLSPGDPRPGRRRISLSAADARHGGAVFRPADPAARAADAEGVQGGRVVTVTGARGGAGASTIAANLAWHFGVEARRHTVLLDADLHRGTAAMLLGAKTGPGLRTALEAPDRIDELFVERAAQPVSEAAARAGRRGKADRDASATRQNAAAQLLDALRRRYNFVVIDVPCSRRCRCIATC